MGMWGWVGVLYSASKKINENYENVKIHCTEPGDPHRPHHPYHHHGSRNLFLLTEKAGREAAWDIFVGGAFLDVTFLPELARFWTDGAANGTMAHTCCMLTSGVFSLWKVRQRPPEFPSRFNRPKQRLSPALLPDPASDSDSKEQELPL